MTYVTIANSLQPLRSLTAWALEQVQRTWQIPRQLRRRADRVESTGKQISFALREDLGVDTMSCIVAPPVARQGLPKKPVKNLKNSSPPMLSANAVGTHRITKMAKLTM